MNYLLPGSPQ